MATAVRIGSVGRIEGFSTQPQKFLGGGVVRKDACGVAFRHHQPLNHRQGAAKAALMQAAPLPMSSVATKLRFPWFPLNCLLKKRAVQLLSDCSFPAQGFCW